MGDALSQCVIANQNFRHSLYLTDASLCHSHLRLPLLLESDRRTSNEVPTAENGLYIFDHSSPHKTYREERCIVISLAWLRTAKANQCFNGITFDIFVSSWYVPWIKDDYKWGNGVNRLRSQDREREGEEELDVGFWSKMFSRNML